MSDLLLSGNKLSDISINNDLITSHGIKLLNKTQVQITKSNIVSIKNVVYNEDENKLILLLTNQGLCVCYEDDKEQFYPYNIIDFIYNKMLKCYIAVCCDLKIRIYNNKLQETYSTSFNGTLYKILYNEFANEILTCGKGALTIWRFHSANTLLAPEKVIIENIFMTDLKCIHIEQTASQRCFVGILKDIFIYELISGRRLHILRQLHKTEITEVLYICFLKLLVTGALDGTIKIWNEAWALCCTFVSHSCEIISLQIYPYGPYILSASKDKTLRVWEIGSKEQFDCVEMKTDILGLKKKNSTSFYLFDSDCFQLWEVKTLYLPFTILGTETQLLKSSNSDILHLPYCLSKDNSIRLICSKKGVIFNMFKPSSSEQVISDVVYVVEKDMMIVLLSNGEVLKVSTKTNPCTLDQDWKNNTSSAHQTNNNIGYVESLKDVNYVTSITVFKHSNEKSNKCMVIAGCSDGCISIFDCLSINGTEICVYKMEAHTNKINLITCNIALNQLATSSLDNSVKVWRIFPFAEEMLSPLLIFPLQLPCTHLEYCCNVLCMVNQDHNTFALKIYNIKDTFDESLCEHSMSHNHVDKITSLSTSLELQLIATTSLDCTVKIWNCSSELIRVLELKSVARSLCFCSERGDLLLGIEMNLCYISHRSYLPSNYLYHIYGMDLSVNKALSSSPSNHNELDDSNRDLFSFKRTSFPCTQFADDTPLSEEGKKDEERLKEKEYILLKSLTEELHLMKEGQIEPHRKRVNTESDKQLAFENYLNIIYNHIRHNLRALAKESFTDLFFAENNDQNDRMKEKINEKNLVAASLCAWRSLLKRNESSCKKGNFAFLSDKLPDKVPRINLSSKVYPLNGDVARNVNRIVISNYYNNFDFNAVPIAPDGHIPNSPVMTLYKKTKKYVDFQEGNTNLATDKLQDESVIMFDKQLPKIFEEPKSLSEEEITLNLPYVKEEGVQNIELFRIQTESNRKSFLDISPATSSDLKKVELVTEVSKPVLKKKRIKSKEVQKKTLYSIIPAKVHSVPSFVAQFSDHLWFNICFPEYKKKTFPKVQTVADFVRLLLQQVTKINAFEVKTDLLKAIIHLQSIDPFDSKLKHLVTNIVNGELLPSKVMSVATSEWLLFGQNCIQLLVILNEITDILVAELIVQCILGSSMTRHKMMKNFEVLGVADRYHYFAKELITAFDVSVVNEADQRRRLYEMCFCWLNEWRDNFKNCTLQNTSTKEKNIKSRGTSLKSVFHQVNVENYFSVTPIDVINFFCEMKFKEHVKIKEKKKAARRKKIERTFCCTSFPRVGEAHYSKCHPDRETTFYRALTFPVNTDVKIQSLLLNMNRLKLNPFQEEDSVISSNREISPSFGSKKYFLPVQSYINNCKTVKENQSNCNAPQLRNQQESKTFSSL